MAEFFRVGDRVEVIEHRTPPPRGVAVGDRGTVVDVDDDGDCYIEFDGKQDKKICVPKRLRLIEDEQKMKFNKGDRVRLTRDRFDNSKMKAGMIGTIYADSDDCAYVEWDGFNNGHDGNHISGFKDDRKTCWIVNPDEVEHLQPEAAAAKPVPNAAAPDLLALLPEQLVAYAELEGVRADQVLYVPVTGAELRRLREAISKARPAAPGKKRASNKVAPKRRA